MRTRVVLVTAALCAIMFGPAQSQSRAPAPAAPAGQRQVESIVVGLEGAGVGGTDLHVAEDLADALNGPGLRVVPISGQGSVQNLDDLLHLRGADAAIVQTDAMALARQEHLLPPGTEQAIQYVAKLYDQEVHILVGPGVHTLADLNGKTVNADLPRSGSALTAGVLFHALDMPVTLTGDPQDVAIEQLKRGEIAAVLRVAGKPVDLFRMLPPEAGLHFISLPQDDERLLRTYAPGSLAHADYPNLIPEGQELGTLTVGAVLAVYAWPPESAHYRQLVRFVQALFAHLDRLHQPPAHPKWEEVNLAAEVPGWTRFAPAAGEAARASDRTVQQFERFLALGPPVAGMTQEQRTVLLEQFTRWRRGERP